MQKKIKTIETGTLTRILRLNKEQINQETRSVELSFSSEQPVERWFGTEILDHSPGAMRMDRIQAGGPLLMDHEREDQVGVIEGVTVTADRRGRAVVRFGKSARAEEVYQDVLDGIRTNVSVGYQIHKMEVDEPESASPTCRAVDWEPLEISIVSIPADTSVGIGRNAAAATHTTELLIREKENTIMPPVIETPAPAATPDLTAIRTEARIGEQTRVRDIMAIGDKIKMAELARTFVDNGKGVDEFRAAILEVMEKRGQITPVSTSAEIGLSRTETKRYSMVRAIHAMANPQNRQAQEAAGFEFEASRATADLLKKTPQGFFIPMEVQQRDLLKGTTTAGGHTVDTTLLSGSFIEMLRNRMMVQRMGATILTGLVGDVAIPSQSGGATAYWVAENGAVTESDQTFGQVTLAPKTVGGFTDLSRKLLIQSSLDVEALVTRDLSTILALEIDRAALHGTAAGNQPRGIAATAGIGSVAGGTNGLAPTWANMIGLWTEVAVDNADSGSLGFLTNNKVIGKMMATQKVPTYGNDFVVNQFPDANGFTAMAGARCGVSNQVSSALTKGTSSGVCSAVFFGNWADLLIGQWGGLDVLVDPYTGGAAGTVRVRVLQDVDVAVRHAESFSAMLDALTV
ncbi:MAG: phage major capsid protein [Desulfobulbaceae bacterium]|nr:phage major capsid protein [Desulfobulbaceae bacterium]